MQLVYDCPKRDLSGGIKTLPRFVVESMLDLKLPNSVATSLLQDYGY